MEHFLLLRLVYLPKTGISTTPIGTMSSFRLRDLDGLTEKQREEKFKRVFDTVAHGSPQSAMVESAVTSVLSMTAETTKEVYSPTLTSSPRMKGEVEA